MPDSDPKHSSSTKSGETRYRLPAEWEPHAATWITWPHNPTDWPGKTRIVQPVYAQLVSRLSRDEQVCILVNDLYHEQHARRYLQRINCDTANVVFHRIRTNRSWMRDYGPMIVEDRTRRGGLAIAGFRFNGWARYPAHQRDARVPEKLSRLLDIPLLPVRRRNRPVILEGGSIDVNGKGTLITTEECLLDAKVQARNPGLSAKDIEEVFREHLGVTNVLWLGRGIAGDDTHGHVDDICRFVSAGTIVLCRGERRSDPNTRAMEENRERLQSARLQNGRKPEVVSLPLPRPLHHRGYRLPASYANFYIGNRTVVVPTFRDPNDRKALGILAELFPSREVTGIDAVDLVWGLGAFHCITMQRPRQKG